MGGTFFILVVEDDSEVRTLLMELLQREGFATRGYSSGEELLTSNDLNRAGCIVLDMRLPEMQGEQVIREVKLRHPAVPLVVVTGFGDVPSAVEAMKAGAFDYLQKPVDGPKFVQTIRVALQKSQDWLAQGAEVSAIKSRISALSENERNVYRLLVAGHPNKQIAAMLQIGLRTVELRRAILLQKMGAGSLPELVRMAILGNLDRDSAA
jgi:two-component system response regulator FixJ